MILQFSLQDLMVFLVCALAIASGALLIPILWNIKKVVGMVRPIVEANQAGIKKSIGAIPGILENVGQISIDVKDTAGRLRTSVPVLLDDVQYAADSARESIDRAGILVDNIGSGISETIGSYKNDTSENDTGFMAYLPVIKEVLQLIFHAFSSRK
jgi:hypothetical protein